jgi:hypothetical protein
VGRFKHRRGNVEDTEEAEKVQKSEDIGRKHSGYGRGRIGHKLFFLPSVFFLSALCDFSSSLCFSQKF